jgi:chorismate dehydratase
LTRILCARLWDIAPRFFSSDADVTDTLEQADAALVIGDRALVIDPAEIGVEKTDLGEAWRTLTGLPFVYAMWTGRDGAVDAEQVAALQAARTLGESQTGQIAREVSAGDPRAEQQAHRYLRDTLKYGLGEREIAGLERFLELSVALDVAPQHRPLRFFS